MTQEIGGTPFNEYHRDYQRERTEKKLAAGLCRQCNKPSIQGETYCQKHKEAQRIWRQSYYAKKRAEGICYECSDKAVEGRSYCQKHREAINKKQKNRMQKLREQGLCKCGNPLMPGYMTCKECNVKVKKQHEERIKAKVCITCKKPTEWGVYCEYHRKKNNEARDKHTKKYGVTEAELIACFIDHPGTFHKHINPLYRTKKGGIGFKLVTEEDLTKDG